MNIRNRYKLIKSKHSDVILLFTNKHGYKTCGVDKEILRYIKFKNNLKLLEQLNISYILIDNISILSRFDCDSNQYDRYLYLMLINRILDKIITKL